MSKGRKIRNTLSQADAFNSLPQHPAATPCRLSLRTSWRRKNTGLPRNRWISKFANKRLQARSMTAPAAAQAPLEIDTRVKDQAAHATVSARIEAGGEAGNLTERTVSVDRGAG